MPRASPETTRTPARASSAAEHRRDVGAVLRARSCADDRDAGRSEELGRAAAPDEQPDRRVVDRRGAAPDSGGRSARPSGRSAPRAAAGTPPRRRRGRTRRSARCAAPRAGDRRSRRRTSPPRGRRTQTRSSGQLLRRPIGERLGEVLDADDLRAPASAAIVPATRGDPGTAAAGEREPLDRPRQQLRGRVGERRRRLGEAATRVADARRAPAPSAPRAAQPALLHANAASSARGRSDRAAPARAARGGAAAAAPCTRTRRRERRAHRTGRGSSLPTSWKRAGNVARPATRDDRRRRRPRAAGAATRAPARANSGSSSRKSTPRCASVASPTCGPPLPPPPPTIAAVDAEWCGARNGGNRTSPLPGCRTPATEWIRVTSSAPSSLEQRQDPRQTPREHRLAGSGRAGEQQVVTAGRGDLERAPRTLLPAEVAEVGRGRRVVHPALVWRRVCGRRLAPSPQVGDRLGEMRDGYGLDAGQGDLGARLGRADDPVEPGPARALGRDERAGHGSEAPVERQLADRRVTGQRVAAAAGRDAASTASAIGRSKPEPSLRSPAGARLTVRRVRGHSSSAEAMPLRTRCLASWQARSARPTIVNDGAPRCRCASTSTRRG